MHLSKAGAAVSFFGAMAIGVGAAYVAPVIGIGREPADITVTYTSAPVVAAKPVRAEDMRGTWIGTWGYRGEACSIEIERIHGNSFYGTLRKEGAVILLEGRLDPDSRTVFFRETKVRKLGPMMSEWSLGTNTGSFSTDGRSLTGSGTDKWGSYGWDARKE